MKNQINLLSQIQELVLTRDEHHQMGDGSRTDSLSDLIDDLTSKLDAPVLELFQRIYKKDHVVMAPMINEACAACGMRLPTSQVQQVRMAKAIQTCSSCGRVLYNEEEDVPRYVGEKPARGEPRKNGISRFSAEELMVCDLKATNAEEAVRELADVMVSNNFVSSGDALVAAAMEREHLLPTAMDGGLAFPHVRGVEGGGLTLALGVSKNGLLFTPGASEKTHLVFFSVIPVAVSMFYLRLMANLMGAFNKKANRDLLLAAKTQTELWKALIKATRHAVR